MHYCVPGLVLNRVEHRTASVGVYPGSSSSSSSSSRPACPLLCYIRLCDTPRAPSLVSIASAARRPLRPSLHHRHLARLASTGYRTSAALRRRRKPQVVSRKHPTTKTRPAALCLIAIAERRQLRLFVSPTASPPQERSV